MKALAKPWSDMLLLLVLTLALFYFPAKTAQRTAQSLAYGISADSGQWAILGGWQCFLLIYAVFMWAGLSAVVIPLSCRWRAGADDMAVSDVAFRVLAMINAALVWTALVMLFWTSAKLGH